MSTVAALKSETDRKADFPGLVNADGSPWHYLDSAATAQKPQAVIDAVSRAIGADYATVHRGVYTRSAEMTLGCVCQLLPCAPPWQESQRLIDCGYATVSQVWTEPPKPTIW